VRERRETVVVEPLVHVDAQVARVLQVLTTLEHLDLLPGECAHALIGTVLIVP
jgi:hypothetical protein